MKFDTIFYYKKDIFNILRFVRRVYIFYTPLLSYIFFIKIFLARYLKKFEELANRLFKYTLLSITTNIYIFYII